MGIIIPNVNAPNVEVITVPLDQVQRANVFVVAPGTPVYTLLVVVPPGVTAYLLINGLYPLLLDVGASSYKTDIIECPYIGGYAITTAVAYPGLALTLFVGGGLRTA
ncbi:MAG: hypothetical protein ACRETL_13070, partial [Gammaproteobacteria bacterium]